MLTQDTLIPHEEIDDTAILSLKGNLMSRPEATNLRSRIHRLAAGGTATIVVDLSETRRLGAAALGELVRGYCLMRESGGDLQLAGVTAGVRSALEVTRLAEVFHIRKRVDDATRGLLPRPLTTAA
jgi:anti-anti-sigma factor